MEGSSTNRSETFFCPTNPHFIKPILPGFQSKLSFPKSFLKYLGEDIKEVNGNIATLRNIRVDNKIWRAEVGFDDDDDEMYLRNGWEKFCDDHGLEVGDFVVFKHHQNLVFDVFILDASTCERPFPGFRRQPQPSKKVKLASSNDNPASKGFSKKMKGSRKPRDKQSYSSTAKVNFVPGEYAYFNTFVKPDREPIPMEFAKKNNLADKTSDLTLIDEKGKEWAVHLRYRKDKNNHSIYIGMWNDFLKRSGLKIGDPIVFELIKSGESPTMKFYT